MPAIGQAGPLFLGQYGPREFIVPRMRAMIGKYVPGVGLRVEIGDSQQIYGKVASGDIELGIIGTIFSSAEVDFTVASKDDRLVVIVPVSHPSLHGAPFRLPT